MTRTAFTLAVGFATCLFAGAQQPEPPKPLALPVMVPDPKVEPPRLPEPPAKPQIEPDPAIRALNDEEKRLRAQQEQIKERLTAIEAEREKAKKRPVGKIDATVEGLLYDADKPHPYILCRYSEQLECRVYLRGFVEDRLTLDRDRLAGKVVSATGRLVSYPPNAKPTLPGVPIGPLILETRKIEEAPPTPVLPGLPAPLPPLPPK